MTDIKQVPDQITWEFVRGDSVAFPFRIGTQYDDGSFDAWDLTGWTIQGQVRVSADSSTALTTITGTPDPVQVNETRGVYTLSLGTTSGLPATCVGDVEFIPPSGGKRTYQRFAFCVTADVSRII